MKKFLYFFLGLMAVIGMSACSEKKVVETPNEKNTVTEVPAKEEPVKEEPTTEEPDSSPDEPVAEEPKVFQNAAFKDVVVTESEEQYVITGKAQVFEGVFQYKLHDGDKVLLEDHYQTAGAPEWGDFEIFFDKELVENTHVLFELFVYSAKDGSKINVLEIPIQL
ncbi:Gmad2 immunoglobulin-like domain-containing protein [Robertmurraya andreesenii]|uniref:Bacterial spore germination immunoglobulin-like domain-containing protein n=1 Tax=Anoxybacillus andreesenii TaxID=1325932 RepID=A0ABT9V132_9BACL|nr:Gmad2 immunoglobulin-like domain-containing protein [Robertmurraya andreesenii]MDQ0154638.1 hypothetical protein [Robertmurraya andreesenii]